MYLRRQHTLICAALYAEHPLLRITPTPTYTQTPPCTAPGATPTSFATIRCLLPGGDLDNDATLEHHLDRFFRDVNRDDFALAAGSVQYRAHLWHVLFCLDIVLVFIREAAKQATAHAGYF